jgi:hypothetical protein
MIIIFGDKDLKLSKFILYIKLIKKNIFKKIEVYFNTIFHMMNYFDKSPFIRKLKIDMLLSLNSFKLKYIRLNYMEL